jgi:hypothetical protein
MATSELAAIYPILLPDGQFTRIMSLQPGEHEATLSCKSRTTSLEEAGEYEALSYTWGGKVPHEDISCNNSTLTLQPNLASALKRLRQPSSTRDLWVDFICINQKNLSERDRQMKYMHEIYKGAKEVIAWIGEETKTSGTVMDHIAMLDPNDAIKESQGYKNTKLVENPRPHVLETDNLEWIEAVDSFMSRPWFRRAWIQQEAVMCPKTTILCGTKKATWNQMFAFVWMLSLGGNLTPTASRNWKHMSEHSKSAIKLVRAIQKMRNFHVEEISQMPSLLLVLHSARLAESKEEKDKIYATQHLASGDKGGEMILEPDNEAKWHTVYKEFATKYLTKRGSPILSYAGRAIQTDHKLPSWVPDWTYRDCYRFTPINWMAGGPSQPKWQVTTEQDQEKLPIDCAIIGKITKLSDTISRDNFSVKSQVAQFEQTAYKMIDRDGLYFDGKTHLEAYSRTLVADNPQDYDLPHRSSPEFHHEFHRKFLQWRLWLHEEASEEQTEWPKYHMAIENTGTFVHKQLGFTDKNHMCLVPALSTVGDQICLLKGLDRPMVVREKDKYREFIGECYVHGVMEGRKLEFNFLRMDFI